MECNRAEVLLSLLSTEERAELDRLIDEFMDETALETAEALHQAADVFEQRNCARPLLEGAGGLVFAAALRRRGEVLRETEKISFKASPEALSGPQAGGDG